MSGVFIARGMECRVDAPVHTWLEHRMHFTCKTRLQTRATMNHWTAAENPPEALFENLRKHVNPKTRKPEPLSVHFAIDALGEVWQFADTEARCSHAAAMRANDWSIGIEFICRGSNLTAPQRGVVRERRHDVIHGKLLDYDTFTPAQVGAGIALNAALCSLYKLPLRVPLQVDGEVYATVLPERYAERYQGALAHLHLTRTKPDCGLDFLRALNAYTNSQTPRPVA